MRFLQIFLCCLSVNASSLLPLWGDDDFVYPEALFPELNSLIQEAVVSSPTVQFRQLSEDGAEASLGVAKSRRWATADLELQGLVRDDYRVNSEVDSNESNAVLWGRFEMSQPLYHFGGISGNIESKEIMKEREEQQTLKDGRALVKTLRQKYFDLVMARIKLKIQLRRLDLSEEYAQMQTTLLDSGNTSEERYLQALIESENARDDKLRTERWIAQLQKELAFSVKGSGSFDDIGVVEFPDIKLVDEAYLQSFYDNMMTRASHDLDYQIEQAKVDSLTKDVQVEGTRTLPQIDLLLGVQQDFVDEYRSGTQSYESVVRFRPYAAVRMKWRFFDGKQTKSRQLSTLSWKRMAEFKAKNAQQQFMNQVGYLILSVKHVIQEIKARETRLKLVEKRLNLAERLSEANVDSMQDYVKAQIDYDWSRYDLLDSKKSYLLYMAELNDLYFPERLTNVFKSLSEDSE